MILYKKSSRISKDLKGSQRISKDLKGSQSLPQFPSKVKGSQRISKVTFQYTLSSSNCQVPSVSNFQQLELDFSWDLRYTGIIYFQFLSGNSKVTFQYTLSSSFCQYLECL